MTSRGIPYGRAVTMTSRRRIQRLAHLLERSDAGTLYRYAPKPVRRVLRLRFARQFARHYNAIRAAQHAFAAPELQDFHWGVLRERLTSIIERALGDA